MRSYLLILFVVVAACAGGEGAGDVVDGGGEAQLPGSREPFDPDCHACHGDIASPAPPRGLGGTEQIDHRGVGAHRSHIGGLSTWHKPVECSACHDVPTETEAPGHIDDGDSKAELTFVGLASTGGLKPTLNDDNTCSNAYCHGATLSGGTLNQPMWTQVDGSQKECGTCHGNPPPAPHPASTDCGACHPSMQAGTDTFLDPGRHIDGVLDLGDGTNCVSCHGSGNVSAPPSDLLGNTARSFQGVGAHRQHLGSADWRRDLTCSNCHVVPTAVEAPGHLDGDNVAEVPFDALNPAGAFSRNNATCNNMYCHGNGKASNGSIRWTSTTAMDCSSCHGFPPAAPHTTSTDCGSCHPSMTAGAQTFRDPSRHIDGVLDVSAGAAACDSCHGSAGISAPPRDLAGNTARSASGVGAHRQHLGGSNWRRVIACESCHNVPTEVGSSGHLDGDNIAEVPFDAFNPSATFNRNNATCNNLYCHGDGNGSNGSLSWTSTAAMDCASCHSYPPPAPHPAGTNCGSCHPNVQPGTDNFIDPSMHIDGVVNVNAGGACDSCHGSNGNPAPPRDLLGNTSRTSPGVGAHSAHLGDTGWSRTMTCQTCHVVPGNVSDPGHLDGDNIAEVPFDNLNPAATVNHGTATCNNLYCHGNGRGNNGTISWTSTTSMTCGSCHNTPAPGQRADGMSGEHDKHIRDERLPCSDCHGRTVNSSNLIIDSGLHINGGNEILMRRGGTYANGRCSNMGCHENESW